VGGLVSAVCQLPIDRQLNAAANGLWQHHVDNLLWKCMFGVNIITDCFVPLAELYILLSTATRRRITPINGSIFFECIRFSLASAVVNERVEFEVLP
jgi:hypothetical protein